MGTTTAQKKLFFNLKKIKNQLAPTSEGDLSPEQVNEISKRLEVKKDEVVSMNRRMAGNEKSLNVTYDNSNTEWQDWITNDELDQELRLAQQQELDERKDLMTDAMNILNDREKEILKERKLNDEPATLDDLSKKFKVSRERIRQIEIKAFEKLQKAMLNAANSRNLLPKN